MIYHTSMNMYHSFNSSWVFLFSCYAADLPFWYISIISKIRMYSSNRKLQEELEICYYLRLRIFRVVGCVPAVWTLTAWLCESWHRAQTHPRNTWKVRPSVQGPPLSLFWCYLTSFRINTTCWAQAVVLTYLSFLALLSPQSFPALPTSVGFPLWS